MLGPERLLEEASLVRLADGRARGDAAGLDRGPGRGELADAAPGPAGERPRQLDPLALIDGGLTRARSSRSRLANSPVPVQVPGRGSGRLPGSVEAALYFVCSKDSRTPSSTHTPPGSH